MKVGNINSVLFRALNSVTKPEMNETKSPQAIELGHTTPNFNAKILDTYNNVGEITPAYTIKTPQRYTKLGVKEAFNGLKIHQYKLANGHVVSIVPMEGSPATVKNYVNVGSMNETPSFLSVEMFRCVALWANMSMSIAGARTTGQRTDR